MAGSLLSSIKGQLSQNLLQYANHRSIIKMSSGETIINVDTSSQAEESESSMTDVIEDVVKLEVDEK